MSKLQRKIQFARSRGVYVFRSEPSIRRARKASVRLLNWPNYPLYKENDKALPEKQWAVYVEGEWYPRINLTKREAVNLAYAISISESPELEVRFSNKTNLLATHKGA